MISKQGHSSKLRQNLDWILILIIQSIYRIWRLHSLYVWFSIFNYEFGEMKTVIINVGARASKWHFRYSCAESKHSLYSLALWGLLLIKAPCLHRCTSGDWFLARERISRRADDENRKFTRARIIIKLRVDQGILIKIPAWRCHKVERETLYYANLHSHTNSCGKVNSPRNLIFRPVTLADNSSLEHFV